jgi:hypothetical protein
MQHETIPSKCDLAMSPAAMHSKRRRRNVLSLAFFMLAVVALVPTAWTLRELRPRAVVPIRIDSTAPALLVHYTDKQRSVDAETQWNTINGRRIDLRFYDDDACLALVKQHRPHFVETYLTELSVVERTDYFRYLAVWVYGGLYADSDIEFHKPVDKWLETFGWDREGGGGVRLLSSLDLVVGVEFPYPQTNYKATGWLPLQINQFLFAGTQGSEILKRIIDHIEMTIQTIPRDDVEKTLERTGPAAFTRAIVNEIETRGLASMAFREMVASNKSIDPRHPTALLPLQELDKNGQLIVIEKTLEPFAQPAQLIRPHESILVLPYRAFGYNPAHGISHVPVLVYHQNMNSWRKNPGN